MQKLNPVDAALLFDYYGSLLTERQTLIWRLYYLEDWSLQEIGQAEGISRAAVHDILTRTSKTLTEYDRKLGLIEATSRRREWLGRLEAVAAGLPAGPWQQEILTVIRGLAEEEGWDGDV